MASNDFRVQKRGEGDPCDIGNEYLRGSPDPRRARKCGPAETLPVSRPPVPGSDDASQRTIWTSALGRKLGKTTTAVLANDPAIAAHSTLAIPTNPSSRKAKSIPRGSGGGSHRIRPKSEVSETFAAKTRGKSSGRSRCKVPIGTMGLSVVAFLVYTPCVASAFSFSPW